MRILRNISLGVALAAALSSMAFDLDLPKRTVDGREYYFYEVPAKETIYSITRRFNITRDDIVRYNPQVIDGLRAGDILYFPVEQEAVEQPVEEVVEVIELPVEEVVEVIPAADTVQIAPPAEPTLPEPEEAVAEVVEVADIEDSAEIVEVEDTSAQLNVAVMLPFMLDAENMTRQVENHTNFYRGMLMALDSLAAPSGLKINLMAFDTEGSPARVAQLMTQPELQTVDFIIAPPDSLGIEKIAAVADSLDACVINLFAVKNDAHERHESVFQANIPHDKMYDVAIEGFCEKYRGRKVIILNATDIPAHKAEFVEELTSALVKKGLPYETINFEGKLQEQDLSALQPEKDYVFIPTCHSREALMKILPALNEFNDTHPTINASLFGYPEWVVLRGDIKERLHRLNATVYSRFSTDLDGLDVRRTEQSYKRWFGTDMPNSLPNTTLLGFDTMAWLIHAVQQGLTDPYVGLQNTFKVQETDGRGDVNTALYFITFYPAGQLNSTVL